ncbi:hypothetical protein AWB67_07228 [Caballeronia terrestris]|jgi:hypothetical protein|uniref:Uncharacterized protein n=2 Tax=Caballeronia TaxID=1827195 RepID=A0A158L151_9BURK|nr:hypothetical protein AWB65_06934 [Caballeronia humi]SAL86570.1 hypothetical protein AWB67_07228 [Caballeronia terrestris]
MCYSDPDAILLDILQTGNLPSNEHGHTALDDFNHFGAYSGCNPSQVSSEAYAWARLAFVSARLRTS